MNPSLCMRCGFLGTEPLTIELLGESGKVAGRLCRSCDGQPWKQEPGTAWKDRAVTCPCCGERRTFAEIARARGGVLALECGTTWTAEPQPAVPRMSRPYMGPVPVGAHLSMHAAEPGTEGSR